MKTPSSKTIIASALSTLGSSWLLFSVYMAFNQLSRGGFTSEKKIWFDSSGDLTVRFGVSSISIHPIFWLTVLAAIGAIGFGFSLLKNPTRSVVGREKKTA